MNLASSSYERKPTQTSNGARTKILFVITKSNYGGAQRYVYDLATRLPRDTFDIAVACGPSPDGTTGRLSYLLNDKEIPTIEIAALARDIGILTDLRAFFALAGLLRGERPDIVHVNSSKAGGLGALAARLCGVRRIVFTIHGLPADENRPLLARWMIALATWLTCIFVHRVITVSHDAYTRVSRLPFLYRKTVLVYNGIEPIEFRTPHEAQKELRTIDPTLPDRFLGTIGELHANKDLETAIAALVHAPEAHLALIGDGEERERLRAHAERLGVLPRVHFLGYVPDAAKYIRAFDAFVLTSRKEGLPYVLLEAGLAHVPIVTVDIPGVRDIVLNEFTGLLVPRDPARVAAALTRLDDEALARSLTEAMAERVRTVFSIPHMLEKTRACYA